MTWRYLLINLDNWNEMCNDRFTHHSLFFSMSSDNESNEKWNLVRKNSIRENSDWKLIALNHIFLHMFSTDHSFSLSILHQRQLCSVHYVMAANIFHHNDQQHVFRSLDIFGVLKSAPSENVFIVKASVKDLCMHEMKFEPTLV